MTWSTTKYYLKLNIKIDLRKYQAQEYKLPPEELGHCKEWRFKILEDEKIAIFFGNWEIRQVNRNIKLEEIDKKLESFLV